MIVTNIAALQHDAGFWTVYRVPAGIMFQLTHLTSLTIFFPMKGKEIGTLEAKTRLSELLDQVQRGQRFFITRHGQRVAELGPISRLKKRAAAGFAKGTFTYVSADFDAPLDDFRDYER